MPLYGVGQRSVEDIKKYKNMLIISLILKFGDVMLILWIMISAIATASLFLEPEIKEALYLTQWIKDYGKFFSPSFILSLLAFVAFSFVNLRKKRTEITNKKQDAARKQQQKQVIHNFICTAPKEVRRVLFNAYSNHNRNIKFHNADDWRLQILEDHKLIERNPLSIGQISNIECKIKPEVIDTIRDNTSEKKRISNTTTPRAPASDKND